jgi:hypothetical protein
LEQTSSTNRDKRSERTLCKNPSHKDEIYSDELEEIKDKFFNKLTGSPSSKALNYSQGNKFDKYIRGWCRYWNDVFKSNERDSKLLELDGYSGKRK